MSITENAAIDNWLAQEKPEPVIEPELPIIDAHHHLWDIRRLNIEPLKSFQQKVYLCEEFSQDVMQSGHNITHTVFAQCNAFYRADGPAAMRPIGETEFANSIAAMSRSGLYGSAQLCAGIFSAADLRLGKDVEPVLQAHLDASRNFRGIRTPFPTELNDQFLAGFDELAKLNLTFDTFSPTLERLPTLAKLAARYPETTIVLNHFGGSISPVADAAAFKRWRDAMTAVAVQPNIVLKLGASQMRSAQWTPDFHMTERSAPIDSESLSTIVLELYKSAINIFGPDRCMFESNFPVDRESVSYRTLWNSFKHIAGKLGSSADEKADLFSGTAARAYKLDPPALHSTKQH